MSNSPGQALSTEQAQQQVLGHMEQELAEHEGLFIGEAHTHAAPKEFLIQNMARLREMGVTTLYIEMLHSEEAILSGQYNTSNQPAGLVDRFNRGEPGSQQEMEDYFAQTWYAKQVGTLYLEVLEVARQNGIRIVGIDSGDRDRARVNEHWQQTVLKDREGKPPEEKYLILGGADHGNAIMFDFVTGVGKGLPYYLDCVSFDIMNTFNHSDAAQVRVGPNYREGIRDNFPKNITEYPTTLAGDPPVVLVPAEEQKNKFYEMIRLFDNNYDIRLPTENLQDGTRPEDHFRTARTQLAGAAMHVEMFSRIDGFRPGNTEEETNRLLWQHAKPLVEIEDYQASMFVLNAREHLSGTAPRLTTEQQEQLRNYAELLRSLENNIGKNAYKENYFEPGESPLVDEIRRQTTMLKAQYPQHSGFQRVFQDTLNALDSVQLTMERFSPEERAL